MSDSFFLNLINAALENYINFAKKNTCDRSGLGGESRHADVLVISHLAVAFKTLLMAI